MVGGGIGGLGDWKKGEKAKEGQVVVIENWGRKCEGAGEIGKWVKDLGFNMPRYPIYTSFSLSDLVFIPAEVLSFVEDICI